MKTNDSHAAGASPAPDDSSFLGEVGEMAMLIRSLDWSASPLGPISCWPQSLRTTVSLCLASNFPINIVWGPEHTQIYNDGYRVVCGDKHPAALGMDYTECWASAWPAIGQPFEAALQGHTSFLENQRMFLFRNGYLEETFFTFSHSPIRDESGGIGGLFHPVTETTASMVGERRTRALRDLTARLGEAATSAEVFRLALGTLSSFDLDLPFVLLYELEQDQRTYRLAGASGVSHPTGLTAPTLAPDQSTIWPMQQLLNTTGAAEVSSLRDHLAGTPCGPYEEAPNTAFAFPIRRAGSEAPVALLMAGASARLPLDDIYRGFYDLIAATLTAALDRVRAYEEERKRADMLAAIDHAKTVFFSNVSHEFRTPLTLMLGPLEEALEANDLPAAQHARLNIASRNAQRLLKLVNTLLDFSRIEAGRNDARFVPSALAPFTAELASNFRSACARAGLDLDIDCPPLGAPVWVDRDMWEKIVLNLLSNAFKFTLQGGIRVALRERAGYVELQVRDTGTGIAATELPRIFERFHRIENQGGRSIEGSGIGLALVRELVQLHGGTITATSADGKGCTFTVTLPFGTAHLPPQQVLPAPEATAHPLHANTYVEEALRWLPPEDDNAANPAPEHLPVTGCPRVVLADDNADMRAYVKRVLEEGGYQVDAVPNGAAALAAVRRAPPDLVLTDVMMPELDGFGLLRALRSDPRTKGVLVILLSARAGEEARVEGLAAGADDYLVKPFSARELRARIDGAVTLARHRREAAAREQALQIEIEAERSGAALRRSEAHVTSLFEQTAAGVSETDLAGRLLRVNDRYCRMVGRSREELIGMEASTILHPDDRASNGKCLEHMMATGEPFELDSRYLRPDGLLVWVTRAVTPIRAADGVAVASILAVVLDITDRKQAEDELRAADRRKDEFLAMLAHELRNPLAPISAAAELMARARLDDARLKQTSRVITRQVRHMTGLVDDLLDVSRVTRGLVTLDRSLQDMKSIVASAVEQVRPLMEAHRHQLKIDLAADSAWVLGDQKRLVQILTNLLNNSAKYTPPGGHIALQMVVEAERVLLSVIDDGIGIAPELQPRVFDLFAQAERSPDRSQGGLGLGLALVKSLVELHGGTVRCYSEGAGKGSELAICLPRCSGAASEVLAPGEDALQLPRNGLRLMIVEDNADAALMLAMLLESAGHEVIVENDSLRALARSRSERPAVCILDIGLPEMDGNELARSLRAQPETADCILIAITGYGQEHDRQAARDAGFDHHFAKPADVEQLTALLDQIAARHLTSDGVSCHV